MKLLSRLMIALLICLVAIPMLASPAQAQDEEPFITVSPSSGHPGEEVTVRGYFFDYDEEVEIYYYRDTSTSSRVRVATDETDDDGDFRITFTVPESPTGEHKVRAEVDSAREDDFFTVEPGLEIDPEEGAVGSTVAVTGTGFDEDENNIEVRYYLDGSDSTTVARNIEADEYGSWDITFNVPNSSRGDHKIDAEGDESSLHDVEHATFSVEPGISLDKKQGSVGDTLTVNGSGFGDDETNIEITWDAEAVIEDIEADDNGTWEESFTVPPSTKGAHKVDAYGRRTTDIKDKTFTVEQKMTLIPIEGHVGTIIEVSGNGFAGGKQVIITYDGSEAATTTTDSQGSFPGVTFEATHIQTVHTVDHPVEATDTAGNSAITNFIMESVAPPIPVLIKPADGSRAGFVGKVTPAFEWSAVTDPSGVSYNLEIATSEDFTEPLVAVTGLTGANYTLPDDEALAYGTYYWRVTAIDGARNDSGWTAPYSFRSGLFPLWASIAIIVLIVVLIGFLVYVFAIKRRRYYY